MVYDKNRSGDPDYDDKQPPEFHAGGPVVSAGDGVIIDPVTGPRNMDGAHASLVTTTDDLDNRPSPGGVAKAGSLVQDYKPEDTPTVGKEVSADSGDVEQIKAGQASVQAANLDNSGVPGLKSDTASTSGDSGPDKTPPVKVATPPKR